MSLKIFHLVFIVLSTATALAFGFWEISSYRSGGSPGSLFLGILSLVCGVVLMVYGQWFLKKMRRMSIAFFALLGLTIFHAPSLHACQVCFADPNSSMAKGVTMAVLFLLGMVVPVLMGFAAFFLYLRKRGKALL